MNREAKRMVLLAIVDGTPTELDQMLESRHEVVHCAHYNFEPVVFTGDSVSCSANLRTLFMGVVVLDQEFIGLVVRCPECRKVYYKVGEPR